MALKPRNIELHIAELQLHGFAPADRHSIAEALQSELGRLLATPEAIPHGAVSKAIDRLNGGTFTVTTPPKPVQVGTQVAKSIMHQINLNNTTGGLK